MINLSPFLSLSHFFSLFILLCPACMKNSLTQTVSLRWLLCPGNTTDSGCMTCLYKSLSFSLFPESLSLTLTHTHTHTHTHTPVLVKSEELAVGEHKQTLLV